MFSFSGLLFFIDTIILALFAFKLGSAKKKETNNRMIDAFYLTILILAISYLIFTIAIFFLNKNLYLFSKAKIIGDFFMYVSFSYGIKMPMAIGYPKIKTNIPLFILLTLSAVGTVFNYHNPPNPVLSQTGMIYWNVQFLLEIIVHP